MTSFFFDWFCTSKFVVRNLTEPSSIWNTMHTRPPPYKAQKASTQKLNEHIKIIQLIQNLPEPHVYSTRSQDLALSDLKGRRSARVCGGQLYFPAQDPNLNPHFHCYWEGRQPQLCICIPCAKMHQPRVDLGVNVGMVKGNHSQCSATVCCMTCITSMLTFWWPSIVGAIFQELQPKQGCFFSAVSSPYKAIYIYLCIYRIISQIWLLYIFVAWFFVQVFLDHIHLLFCEPTSTHTDEHSHFNRLPQNLCDATTTLRVVHIILHNCKFISPPTPPGWNIYQVAEASFVIHLCDLLARTWGDRWLTVVNSWDTQMETLYFWKPKL